MFLCYLLPRKHKTCLACWLRSASCEASRRPSGRHGLACTILSSTNSSFYRSIMPAPRPILKGLPSPLNSSETASNPFPFSSCSSIVDSPHVHFPPTPTLTSTEITHSSFMYDRAPIVVTPNVCALPERGGRKFTGSNSNQGGLGYFHPHAKFQVNAVRDSVETVSSSPTIFSASVTVANINERGSVELFMKKRSGPMHDYDYEYDQYSSHDQQHTQHTEHIVSSLLFDNSSDSSDLGVFYTPPPCIPTPPSSSSSSSSIPHSSLSLSPRHVYDTSTAATSSPGPNNMASHSDKLQDNRKNSMMDVGRKKRGKNRVEGECRTKWTMLRRPGTPDNYISAEEGCLGGF